ncbi:hypothetical protein [Microbispora amethystogenes]|nr:hypothetical protein [Microbispora amethystogenes]
MGDSIRRADTAGYLPQFRPLAGEPNPFAELPRGAGPGSYEAELPLNGFSSEKELADRVLERLEPWFWVDQEVSGTHCTGVRLRIDAMIWPRDFSQWKAPDVAFGIEFKAVRTGRTLYDPGLNAYTRWVAQAADYTHTNWDGYGRRLILCCPGVVSALKGYAGTRDARGDLLVAKRLMGQLGVGELVLRWGQGLTILFNGERVWSERGGVSKGKYWSLRARSGSR